VFVELLSRVINLARDGRHDLVGLPDRHPLVQFAKNAEDLKQAIALDDTVVWGALPLMAEASDSLVAEFSQRLRERNLMRCIDIRMLISKHSHPDAPEEPGEALKTDVACEKVIARLDEWNSYSRRCGGAITIQNDGSDQGAFGPN
jgi:hypothetical protein